MTTPPRGTERSPEPDRNGGAGRDGTGGAELQPLDLLLDHLKRARGFDISGYKRSSLERPIAKRMEDVDLGLDSYLGYLDYLEVHPDEFARLFDAILINVTVFFRDPAAWEFLAEDILPTLLERIPPDAPVRVWCAGCASGEEAYTLAIVLAEAMGVEDFLRRVKIYATDVDDDALATARHGSYTGRQVDGVPQLQLERYFERNGHRFQFRADLRRALVFGRNDLVHNAPISRIDLLSCRNTLIYFNAETQRQILGRFNFALNRHGYLFLGGSEMLVAHADLFTSIDVRRRVFSKVTKPTLHDRLRAAAPGEAPGGADHSIRDTGFDAAPVAQVLLDGDGTLVLVNRQARDVFGLRDDDLGRAFTDLGISYRPADLRASLERAILQQRAITLGPMPWTPAFGSSSDLEVRITPLISGPTLVGTSITYDDVTAQRRLRDELERARDDLSTSYDHLRSTVEDLATTNEELQSTNEELDTTNEELQATNEELETTNEELQSTDEELRRRTLELDEGRGVLDLVLANLGAAIVVLDREGRVAIWNARAEELWGLTEDDAIGVRFLDLEIGLPMQRVTEPVERALRERVARSELTLPATSAGGRAFEARVTSVPLAVAGEIAGAILIVEQRAG